ncbi:L-threonine 3-dehydrogenase [Sporosarcina newyorkensis 2681]|uniref:L-threonine 3-dehydrogenase n=1 Tax=Sporosarcina newyorkensis 2681 TaxID=1027292 RepID=F9DRQ9_9BACL|nr:alcohol dehydrogenase catalytic domain-containing protein [Sporosarcina newyorkensis]EGQ26562.1 L-threonine 3-dehydrogenase [Sporosarcina newyorkensis 2681]
MKTMKAAVYEGPRNIKATEVDRPEEKEGWALVKVDYCGICGTDMNIYAGTHPRAYTPLIIGHEFTGTIIEHSDIPFGTQVIAFPLLCCGKCEPCRSGKKHICEELGLFGIDEAGGMAEYVLVPEDDILPLPEGISPRKGALIEPLAVAVHAVRIANIKLGDRAVVFGAGPIGICVAATLKLNGIQQVSIVEVNEFRKQLAKELGFPVVENAKDLLASDIVFDCAAHPAVANQLIRSAKPGGEIILVGTYKFPEKLDLQGLTFKELSVKGARVYTKQDYEIAISLLFREFDFEKIITHEFLITEVDQAFELASSQEDSMKILISFENN